jgi:hypothetical protein
LDACHFAAAVLKPCCSYIQLHKPTIRNAYNKPVLANNCTDNNNNSDGKMYLIPICALLLKSNAEGRRNIEDLSNSYDKEASYAMMLKKPCILEPITISWLT